MPATKVNPRKKAKKPSTEKQMSLSVIRSLPDDADMARILDDLAMNSAIQQGIAKLDAGLGIPHEEVVKRSSRGAANNLVSPSPNAFR